MIRIQSKSFGPNSTELARSWRNLAIANMSLKELGEAENCFRIAIRTLECAPEPDSLELSSWLREYAQLSRQAEHYAQAEQADVRASSLEVRNAIKAAKNDKSKAG